MAKAILETHPFEAFIPPRLNVLIVGSFPGKEQTGEQQDVAQWFYGAPRNQLWKILEIVYGRPLNNRQEKERLFTDAGIGITDMIRSCIRINGTNLDENLEVKEYNDRVIGEILEKREPKVLFTSRFVEKEFNKFFPEYHHHDLLPSPSPRYFRLSIQEKANIYRLKLPLL